MEPDLKDWSPREFFDLAELLGERWSEALPFFALAVAKWRYEDLVPGLSDIDPRVLCRDMGPDEWLELDRVTGEMQLDILLQHPEWSRKLEHTPGVCLTLEEVFDPLLYQPEARQWSYYYGAQDDFHRIKCYLRDRPWDDEDEWYHLGRWLAFYGPYNREIDPAINVSPAAEAKYPLHSRAMHYFVPALQAACSLLTREAVGGKRETLYRWLARLPREPVLHEVMHMLEVHYEVPALADRHKLHAFEERCFAFLRHIAPEVLHSLSVVEATEELTMDGLRSWYKAQSWDPLQTMFTGVKYARIRVGRWAIYLQAPPTFATEWLLVNEVRQLRAYFTQPFFSALAHLRWGEPALAIERTLTRLVEEGLSADAAAIVQRVFELSRRDPAHGAAREIVEAAAPLFPHYYRLLETLFTEALGGCRRLLRHDNVERGPGIVMS